MLQLQNFEIVVLGRKKMCYCKRVPLGICPGRPSLWIITKRSCHAQLMRDVVWAMPRYSTGGLDMELKLNTGCFVPFPGVFSIALVPDWVVWSTPVAFSSVPASEAGELRRGWKSGLGSEEGVSSSADGWEHCSHSDLSAKTSLCFFWLYRVIVHQQRCSCTAVGDVLGLVHLCWESAVVFGILWAEGCLDVVDSAAPHGIVPCCEAGLSSTRRAEWKQNVVALGKGEKMKYITR